MKRSAVLAFLALVPALASAQAPTAGQVDPFFTGAGAPARIRIAELSPTFHAFHLKIVGQNGGGMSSLLTMIMSAASASGGRNSGPPPDFMSRFMGLNALNDLYWSDTRTASYGGHDYLIAYRLQTGLVTASLTSGIPKFGAALHLTLIRTDQIATIEPEPSLTSDALRETLKKAQVSSDEEGLMADDSLSPDTDDMIGAAILFPVFAQAKLAAQKTVALSNAKQLSIAVLMYENDNDDRLPKANSQTAVRATIHPYLKNDELWKSPNPAKAEFLFNMALSGVNLTTLPDPANMPVIYESAPWADGTRVVAFADGHATRVSATLWQTQLAPKLKKAAKPKKKH
jgi:hypothetical protein